MDVTGERPVRRDQQLSAVLWRGRWLIVVPVIAAILVAELMNVRATKVYQATAVLQAQSEQVQQAPTDPLTLQQASQGAASTYARLLSDRTVLEELSPRIFGGSLSVDELQSRTSASAVTGTSLIQVSATGNSVPEARTLATQLVAAFVSLTQASTDGSSRQVQGQLQRRITELTTQIQKLSTQGSSAAEQLVSLRAARAALNQRLASEVANGIEQQSRIRLVAPPAGAATPVRPRTMLNLIGGALLGFLIGVGLALLRGRLDTLVRSSREVAETLDTPVLASIPRVGRPESSALVAEAYEVARTNLTFLAADSGMQVIAVTSYTAGEGKSSSAASLARAIARSGKRVLMIDGDMRSRGLTRRHGYAGKSGLSFLLSQPLPERNVEIELEPNLWLMPAGTPPPDPVQLLASTRMEALLDDLRESYDLILVDTPPVVHLADAPILSSLADGIVVVARAGLTKQSYLTDLRTQLQNIPRPLLGAIVIERQALAHDYPIARSRPAQPAAATDLRLPRSEVGAGASRDGA